MARPGPMTQAKRNRERKKQEKKKEKEEKKMRRAEAKAETPDRDPFSRDPDIADIVPGPQPPIY